MPYLSIELKQCFFELFNKCFLDVWVTQNIVWGYTCLQKQNQIVKGTSVKKLTIKIIIIIKTLKILNVQQHHFVHHVHFPQLQYKYMVTTHLSSICKLSPAYSFDSNLKVTVFVNIAWAKVKQITCNYSL